MEREYIMPDNRKKVRRVKGMANWELELLKVGLPVVVPLSPLMKAKFVWGAADLIQRTVGTLI